MSSKEDFIFPKVKSVAFSQNVQVVCRFLAETFVQKTKTGTVVLSTGSVQFYSSVANVEIILGFFYLSKSSKHCDILYI